MAELKNYILEPISTSKIQLFKPIIDNLKLVWHSLLPHALPLEREHQITVDSIDDNNTDIIYESSLEIYKNSKERISSLESKAFNLMTYISAITAILFFLIDKDISILTKTLAVLSLALLILALLLSLRCIGIKIQKTLFIDSMFEFNESNPKSKNKKHISVDLINNALFNQCIADNTADILKASRILLFYGVIVSSITFFSFILSSEKQDKMHKIELVKSQYLDSIYTNYSTRENVHLKQLNNKISILETDIKKITKDTLK